MIHVFVDSVLVVKWYIMWWEPVAEVTHTLTPGSRREEGAGKGNLQKYAPSDRLPPAKLCLR